MCNVKQDCYYSTEAVPEEINVNFLPSLQVLQQNTLVEACDSHYHTMAGLNVEQLLSVQSQDMTKGLPGVRGGVAPYIMSVMKRKQMYEESMLVIIPVHQSGDRSQVTTSYAYLCRYNLKCILL